MTNEDSIIAKLVENSEHHWLILKILSYLSIEDIAAVSQVSKVLHKLANNQKLWALIADREGKKTYTFVWNAHLKNPKGNYKTIIETIKAAEKQSAGLFAPLPLEVLLEIFSYLTAKELTTASRVSKFLKLLAENNDLWMSLLKKAGQSEKIVNNSSKPAKMIFKETKETRKKAIILGLQKKFEKEYPYFKLTIPKPKPFELSFLDRFRKPEFIAEFSNICSNKKHGELRLFLQTRMEEIKKKLTNEYNLTMMNTLLVYALNNPDPQVFVVLANFLSENCLATYMEDLLRSGEKYYSQYAFIIIHLAAVLHKKLLVSCFPANPMPIIHYAIRSNNKILMQLLIAWDPSCVTYNSLELLVYLSNSDADSEFNSQLVREFYPVLKFYPSAVFEILELILTRFSHYALEFFAAINRQDIINFRDDKNHTLLSLAISKTSSCSIINAIMNDYERLVNISNNNKQTPLMLLIIHNKNVEGVEDSIELLIEKGADINFSDSRGLTALDFAKSTAIRKLLLKHGAQSGLDEYKPQPTLKSS